jgi:hypothetical protein
MVDELLNGRYVLRSTKLRNISSHPWNLDEALRTSRMLFNMLDPVPVSASYIGFTEPTKYFSMMIWLMAVSVVCKVGLVGVMISCRSQPTYSIPYGTMRTAVSILSASRKFFKAATCQGQQSNACVQSTDLPE